MNFFSVIPAPVLRCKVLIPNAKLLYGFISASLDEDGFCCLTNEELANLFGVKHGSISVWISQLKNLGYIGFEMEFQSSKCDISKRKIYLNLGMGGVMEKRTPPLMENHYPPPTEKRTPPLGKPNKIKGFENKKEKKEKNVALNISSEYINNNTRLDNIKEYLEIFEKKRKKFFEKNDESVLPFFWDAKECKHVKNIRQRVIMLLRKTGTVEMDEAKIIFNFDSFLERFINLENDWMPTHGLSPSWIISNWNNIINQMQNQKNGKSNSKTTIGEKGRNNQFTQDDAARVIEKLREKGIA